MSPRPSARSSVSPQRYLVRRVVAGLILGVVLLGVVRVVGGLFGSDTVATLDEQRATQEAGEREAPGQETSGQETSGQETSGQERSGRETSGQEPAGDSVSVPQESDDGTNPPLGVAAGSGEGDTASAAADTTREPRGAPTPADPARVLIVGDSDAGTFGPYLQQLLAETRVTETVLDYKVSSGLARPDFFDWHAELERKVPEFDPDIVVVTFGGNDGQFLADRSGSSVVGQTRPDADNSAWTTEYRARVGRVLDYLDDDGRTVIWVGIPNHVDPDVRFRMQLQDEAVKAEVAEHPDVRFVDAWSRFAGRRGGFAEFVVDPRDGQGKPVRASDGFHLNRVGAEILAIDISQVVFDELRRRGAEI